MNQSQDRNPVEVLADEFVERFRRGERPALSEYTDRHPEWAEEIRGLFPLLVEMEGVRSSDDSSPRPHPPTAGELEQIGDFRIIREIGRGGMGIVYEAEQLSLGRHVALKVLSGQMLLDEQHRRRFDREVKSAARLHHTNIVPVFGVGAEAGMHYYIMQFIQGLGLDQVIDELVHLRAEDSDAEPLPHTADRKLEPRRDVSGLQLARSLLGGQLAPTILCAEPEEDSSPSNSAGADDVPLHESTFAATSRVGRLSDTLNLSDSSASLPLPGMAQEPESARHMKQATYWHSVARIGRQVADALEYAHEQGILHRDVKPSNLLLDLKGCVWVTDFGLAKATDQQDITHTGDILGTLRYMPPEAFEGKADPRSDVYSLGLTLYELLALRPAFGEKDRHKLIAQVTGSQPERLELLNPEIPRDLATIVQKAIDPDPSHRYQSAGELSADLDRFVSDEPIRARRLSRVERLARWSKRNPAIASLCGVIAVMLLAVTSAAVVAAAEYRALAGDRQTALGEAVDAKGRAEQSRDAAEKARTEEERLRLEADRLAEERRQSLYASEIQLAQREIEAANIERVLELLGNHIPKPGQRDLRGFEWYYLWRRCHSERQVLTAPEVVRAVAFSPDGKTLAMAGGAGGGVTLWNVAEGKPRRSLRAGFDTVWSLAFSPDGNRLAIGGQAEGQVGRAAIVDLETGKTLHELKRPDSLREAVTAVVFSPDGKTLAIGAAMYHGQGGTPLTRLVWISSQSRTDEVVIWDAESGERLRSMKGRTGGILALDFSPDGKTLAAGGWDSVLRTWDAATGEIEQRSDDHTGHVWSVKFSPDGKRLASGAGKWDGPAEIILWDRELKRQDRLRGHRVGVTAVAFSPDGKRLASASWDRQIKLWDLNRGLEIESFLGHESYILDVAFSPDGELLASGSWDRTARLWYVDKRLEETTVSGSDVAVYSLSFSPDGRHLAAGSPDAAVIDLQSKKTIAKYPVLGADELIAYSPDGSKFATVGWGGVLTIREAGTGKILKNIQAHREAVWSLAFSPDGKTIATGSKDNTARLWDVATGEELERFEGSGLTIRHLAFSPDGKWLAGNCHRQGPPPATDLKVWEIASGKLIVHLKSGEDGFHTDNVEAVAFTPDGKLLATAGHDQTARIWNTKSWELEAVLKGHQEVIYGIDISPDGRTLATASWDGTVKLWSFDSRQLLLTLGGHEGVVYSVAFSPDGRTLAVGSGLRASTGLRRQLKIRLAARDEQVQAQSTSAADVSGAREKEIRPTTKHVRSLSQSSDGQFVALSTWAGNVLIWDLKSERVHKELPPAGRGACVAFSPNGKHLAVADREGNGWIFDVLTGEQSTKLTPLEGGVKAIAWSPDGQRLAAGGEGKKLVTWNTKTGAIAVALEGHPSVISGVAYSPDGRFLASSGWDNKVHLWNLETEKHEGEFQGHSWGVTSVAFSPDGRTIAGAGGFGDPVIRVWNVETGEEKAVLEGHADEIVVVAFLSDGQKLVSLAVDRTIRLWDFKKPEESRVLLAPDQRFSAMSLSSDGGELLTANPEGLLRIWDFEQLEQTLPVHPGPRKSFYEDVFEN